MTTPSGSQITVNPKGKATLHTFVSPENSFQVTSHIIETENGLVVVDTQFVPALAEEVYAYARQLGKPILRVIISHAHPDHFIGSKVFGDVPVYASQATRDFIRSAGQAAIDQYKMGTQAVVPTHLVEPGEEVVDGLSYKYQLVSSAEAEEHLLIVLPEIGVIIAQDLVYNRVHLYLGIQQFAGWRKAVEGLESLNGYDLILAGHGLPATSAVYAEMKIYLEAAQKAFRGTATPKSVKETLEQAFPEFGSVGLLHLGVDHAFARSGAAA